MARGRKPKQPKPEPEPTVSIVQYAPDYEQYQNNEKGQGSWWSYQDRKKYVTLMREIKILELRLSGLSFSEIAFLTGFRSEAGVRKAYERAMKRLAAESNEKAEKIRKEEDSRYMFLLRVLMPEAMAGNLKAVDRVLKISKGRRDLWGLDAPEQVDITLLLRQAAEAEGLNPDEVVAEAMKIIQEE